MSNKAIFLDRDGVINKERNYTYTLNDFVLLPDLFEALLELRKKGYLLIVVSNQGGIAKGLYGKSDVELLHNYLKAHLKKEDIDLAEIYYCPHHDEYGKCICRKPNSLLIEKAIGRFNIDPSKSFFIGDKQRDVDAGARVGVQGFLIESNSSLLNLIDKIP